MMILGEKKMANNVIELKGKRFVQASKTPGSMIRSMNGKFTVTCPHLHNLHTKLLTIRDFWEKESRFFDGVLINVVYNKIAAKGLNLTLQLLVLNLAKIKLNILLLIF